MLDYIDVFPVRIHPHHLETITSGLTRVSEENRVTTVGALRALVFPRQGHGSVCGMTDLPPDTTDGTLADLTRAIGIAEDALLRMTMHHLGRKFGYNSSQGTGIFLAGSLAPHLRYCPLCVAEYGYYSLPWRFVALTGCPTHGCRLRDRCGNCGGVIRLLPQRLCLGVCAACGNDLRRDPVETMSKEEAEQAWLTQRELTFLLRPHPDEDIPNRFRDVYAKGYIVERLRDKMTVLQVAQALGLPPSSIHGLERGDASNRQGRLATYLAYARCLGTTLDALYVATSTGMALDVAPQTLRHVGRPFMLLRDRHEAELIARLRDARERLRDRAHLATRVAILHEAGLGWSDIRPHRQVRSYLQSCPLTSDDADVIACVEVAIAELRSRGQGVTVHAVARRIRTAPGHVRTRACAMSVLALYGCRDEVYLAQEGDVLRRVREAYEGLQEGTQGDVLPPRIGDVGAAVGSNPAALRYYPRVKAFLDMVVAVRREAERAAKERQAAAIRARVEEIVRHWDDPTPIVSVDDVAQRAGISIARLRSCPDMAVILDSVATRVREQRARETQEAVRRRDEELLVRVEDAIVTLRQAGQRPRIQAVARHLGVSVSRLHYYPRTIERLRQIA
jgi:transcriptional regulator with XRE-family HTH domain